MASYADWNSSTNQPRVYSSMPTRVQTPEQAMNYAGKALMGHTPPVLSGGKRSRRRQSRRQNRKNRKSRRR
uniref:Uncharacterized protein n=1 Tax=viral metagenome TaxID=1070528 RepID=A0A6C0B805_9ZZZZ